MCIKLTHANPVISFKRLPNETMKGECINTINVKLQFTAEGKKPINKELPRDNKNFDDITHDTEWRVTVQNKDACLGNPNSSVKLYGVEEA